MAIFLDTETTGLSPARGDAIVEVAIVDASGRVLVNTLVDPGRPIPWQATRVHGITDAMVRGRPTLRVLMPRILEVVESQQVVIYNASFDAPFFPGSLHQASRVDCAMRQFAEALGGGWRKLDVAASHVGHHWTGSAHRALADALACRSVWEWLESDNRQPVRSPRRFSDRVPGAHRGGEATSPNGATSVVVCPECRQRLRVPSGKLLDVTCVNCRRVFRVQS